MEGEDHIQHEVGLCCASATTSACIPTLKHEGIKGVAHENDAGCTQLRAGTATARQKPMFLETRPVAFTLPVPTQTAFDAHVTPSRLRHPFTLASPFHTRITAARPDPQAHPNVRVRSGQSVCAQARSVVRPRVTARGGCSQACFTQVGGQKGLGTDWIKSILQMRDEYHASMA